MFVYSKIAECFSGLIGFSRPYDNDIFPVDEDLQASKSLLYVDQLHPLLRYENILNAAERFSRITVRAYSGTANYKVGDITKGADNKIYQAIAEVNGVAPPSEANWKETNLFSAYLRRMYNTSVSKLVSSIFTEKKLNEQGRTLLASSSLFSGHGYIGNRITRNGKFRGLKVTLKHPDTVLALKYIGLQLANAQEGVKIYIYHSSRDTPLHEITFSHPNQSTYFWHKLPNEILLPYFDFTNAVGGSYYIGYYEDDLTVDAIERETSFDGRFESCSTCTNTVENSKIFRGWSQYASVKSFYVNESDLFVDNSLWSPGDENHEDRQSYGINLQFSVSCDVTTAVCLNAEAMTDALAQQLKVDFLQEMSFNLRDNQKSEVIAQLAAVALDNREDTPGELSLLQKAKKAVSVDLSRLSKICLPCEQKQLKIGSVWK